LQVWRLYQTAKATSQRPSDLVGVSDRYAALQFDNAIMMVGSAIDNAAQETYKTGPDDRPRWERKYTMRQLLDNDFKLPLGDDEEEGGYDAMSEVDGIVTREIK